MKRQTEQIIARLRGIGDPDIASHSQRFFKTGPGEYGHGDIFLGIRVPVIRSCVRDYRDLRLDDILELLESPFHEARLLALLIMVSGYASADDGRREAVYNVYLDNTARINNWDLVDCSAEHIVGAHLHDRERTSLYLLARSQSLWERRIAIISTFHFIKKGDLADTLAIAKILLHDREDLIHKAAGWMLREVGKRDNCAEKEFLDRHCGEMPRTMLRYAIERFPEEERLSYLRGGQAKQNNERNAMTNHLQTRTWPAIDSHVDLLYDMIRHHPDRQLKDIPDAWVTVPRLVEGGVRLFVSVFYCPDAFNGPVKAADYLRYLLEYAEKHVREFKVVRCAEELTTVYHGSGTPGALLLLENADPLLEYPPQALKERGFLAVGLTHVGRNRVGCGNTIEEPQGLTPAGRKLVKDLDRLGFAIDTAHLSEPAFQETADLFTGPLFSSHTGFRDFNDTPRNLSDGQIRTILSRDGVVGMAAAPGMISDDAKVGISHVFHQIEWFVQKYGAEGIAIGSDMGGYDGVCDGFNDHSCFPRLAELLSGAGYPDSTVQGIMGGNWFRFFSRLLASSSAENG